MLKNLFVSIGLAALIVPHVVEADLYNPATDYMNEGKYGLYFAYFNNLKRDEATIDEFNGWVNDFDVIGFASDVERTGAEWVVWPLGRTWFNAPNAALDSSVGDFTSDRDLPMEIADALAAKGIGLQLMFRCDKASAREDSLGREALGWDTGSDQYTTAFVNNWADAIQVWSDRYGDKVQGWMLTSCSTNTFSASETLAELTPQFETLRDHALSGNPDAVITINGSDLGSLEDFTGDAATQIEDLSVPSGRWSNGLQSHQYYALGSSWGAAGVSQSNTDLIGGVLPGILNGGAYTFGAFVHRQRGDRTLAGVQGSPGRLDQVQIRQLAALNSAVDRIVPDNGNSIFTRIENTNSAVRYTGEWSLNRNSADSGGSSQMTEDPGAAASLTFEGTSVRLAVRKGAAGGLIDVELDGQIVLSNYDTYSNGAVSEIIYANSELEPGQHIIRLIATGERGPNSRRGRARLDFIEFADQNEEENPPNILFILLDDLGKDWVQAFGGGVFPDGSRVNMPNVDRLASEGTSFRNFYVMPQCTPTRVSFMTGQYPYNHGWVNHWDVPRWGGAYFDADRYNSTARILKNAGYHTAVAGKWQINDFRIMPDAMERVGFDEYMMWTGFEANVPESNSRYYDPYIHSVGSDGEPVSRTYPNEFGPDLFSGFVSDFIREKNGDPWFVYYPMVLPHGPFTSTPAAPNVSGSYDSMRAMVEYTDIILGRLLDVLEETGQADNTYIIWTTDNGTTSKTTLSVDGIESPYAKGTTREGGTNSPLVIRGPGLAAGVESDVLVDITDMLPTFADLAGTSLPDVQDQPFPDEPDWYVVDGQSFAPYLRGMANEGPRSWIMSMGGGNNAQLIEGPNGEPILQNRSVHRDRQIRDENYKVTFGASPDTTNMTTAVTRSIYVGPTTSQFTDDRWGEEIDISDSTSRAAQRAFEALREAHDSMPFEDNDPRYAPMDRPVFVPVRPYSELDIWKR